MLSFIRTKFSQYDFKFVHIGKEINKIQRDFNYFQSIIEEIEKSDGIIISTPVYAFLVPSQLERFIELIFDHKKEASFKNKYVTTLTTSIHVFDYAAHNYLNAICEDLGMKYVDGFPAGISGDLLKKDKRVLSNPAPQVAVKEFADSAVILVIRPWVKTQDYWDFYFDYQKVMKEKYDKEGINIPYPQMDVHLDK